MRTNAYFYKKQMPKITKREFCRMEKLKCHHKRKINNDLIYALPQSFQAYLINGQD